MKRWTYTVEDMRDGHESHHATMRAAKEAAKTRSLATGHAVAVIAVDERHHPARRHPQGAYYGRSWRGGAHHYR